MAKLLRCSQLNIVTPKNTLDVISKVAERSGLLYSIHRIPAGNCVTFWGNPPELSMIVHMLNDHEAAVAAMQT